jgi:MYXO-CTERM domain-containing protein
VVGACLLLPSSAALANGRFPLSNQIVFSPTDPNVIVLRTSYGILQSRDNGCSWQYLCEDALGIPTGATLDPELGLTRNNTLVAAVTTELREKASYLGLDVSPDLGCTWNCIGGPLEKQAVTDVVVRPDAPDVVLAVTSTQLDPDAGGGSSSQVFQSMDDGVTWSPLGTPIDRLVEIQTIDVVRGDPRRIYLSGTRGVGPQRTASLFVSMDQGNTWTERSLSQFDPNNEQFLWIAAIDPISEDRVYLRSNAPAITGGKSRLYVTNDAGQSFQMALEFTVPPPPDGVAPAGLGEMLGFALSSDGSKLYAGTMENGLVMASQSDMKFQTVNSAIDVQCLATRGNELWACNSAFAKFGFIVGVSTDDGAHFCPKMNQIVSITGPLSCNAGSTFGCGATINGSQCQMQFDAFCQYYATSGTCSADSPGSYPAGCPGPGTACAPDAGPGTKSKSSGCGCSFTSGGGVVGGVLALIAGLAVALRRRRTHRF